MLINASFLAYRPAQIAAASLLLGMRMKQLKDSNLLDENLVDHEGLEAAKDVWNKTIEGITGLDYDKDVK